LHNQVNGEKIVIDESHSSEAKEKVSWQVRARTWKEFKRLVGEKKPKSIVYILEQNGFSTNKEITILKVIMLHERQYFVFVDAPKGNALRETGLQLREDKNGSRYIDDQEVKNYLKQQFEGSNLEIYSFWTT